MCHEILKPYKETPRNCRLPEWKDGWCRRHHPETIEERVVDEMRWATMAVEKQEAALVGTFLRHRHPDLFAKFKAEAEELKW